MAALGDLGGVSRRHGIGILAAAFAFESAIARGWFEVARDEL